MHTTKSIYIVNKPVNDLKPDPRNARVHSKKQIEVLARAIKSFGFNNPVLIDRDGMIIAGHGRIEAAKLIGMMEVPTVCLEHLTPEQVRAYRIADNRIAELASWNEDLLRIEFQELSVLNLDFNITDTGFDTPQIDIMIMGDSAPNTESLEDVPDITLAYNLPVISRLGDIWQLGKHRIVCGDSLLPETYQHLIEGDKAGLIFTDPPYNVPINGHVLTENKNHSHDEFVMASGEMTQAEFQQFLRTVSKLMVEYSQDGSLHFICMDWRHIYDLLHAATPLYSELKNICIWNKTNGGMGSLYRSKHEMIALFKNGKTPHTNNIELEKHGRYRTNVWDYAGQNIPTEERLEALTMHPTVKPVKMIEDAIYDCSHRGDIILDPFGGSGSTLIAAEKAGRCARLIEISPRYVDVTIQRWQKLTGSDAVEHNSGKTFNALTEERGGYCYVRK